MDFDETYWCSCARAAAIFAGAPSAYAGVVFSDNFDADNPTLNWPGDGVFQSIPQSGNVQGLPSVDLVSASDGFPGPGVQWELG